MTNIAPNETVTLIIGKAEALMLFDLPFDFYRQPTLEIKDDAQRLALVRVHGALESTLVEPFSKDYGDRNHWCRSKRPPATMGRSIVRAILSGC
jgi:hypothetical protein